jgi:PEP-CTERM motif
MKTKPTNRIAAVAFLAATASASLLALSDGAANASTVNGPVGPAAIGVTATPSGVPANQGTRTFTYTGFNPSTYDQLWFGLDGITASMDGTLSPLGSPTFSNGGLTATWTGTTSICGTGWCGGINTEFVATIVSGSSGWITPGSVSISGPLAVAEITSGPFVIDEQFLASDGGPGGPFTAFLTLNNALHPFTSGLAQTNVTGEFFYTDPIAAAAPEPSTWAMMILGFAGIGFTAYRKRNRTRQFFRLA